LAEVRLETERLVLRLPAGDEALQLASLAPADLENDPSWPAPAAAARPVATEVLQWWWRALGTWKVEHWRLPLGVWWRGEPVGFQELEAERFDPLRTVETSSWLVPGARGQRIGVEMRAAVLGLAFDHLGAEVATSGAWEENAGSLGVSRSLGYEDDGQQRHVHHDRVGVMRRVRLPVARWDGTVHPVTVHGLDACRGWFGEP
jgi:RimJ/RimL family protein N-acetyltransferase